MPSDVPYINDIMKEVAQQNDLDFNQDLLPMGLNSDGYQTVQLSLNNPIF
jgi:hypothetical protein